MKDWHLILIIGVFVILDLILLTIVTAVDSSRYTVKIIPDKEHPGTSVEVRNYIMFLLSFVTA